MWSLSISTMRDKESYFREWALNYLGAARTAVSSNMSRSASLRRDLQKGEPSRALRHSSQPLSDNKNILDYVLWTDGSPTTIKYRPDRNGVHVYRMGRKQDTGLVLHSIHQSSCTVRDVLLLREHVKSLWEGNLIGIRSHIIRSLSHLGH
jgi:hypothetical protein